MQEHEQVAWRRHSSVTIKIYDVAYLQQSPSKTTAKVFPRATIFTFWTIKERNQVRCQSQCNKGRASGWVQIPQKTKHHADWKHPKDIVNQYERHNFLYHLQHTSWKSLRFELPAQRPTRRTHFYTAHQNKNRQLSTLEHSRNNVKISSNSSWNVLLSKICGGTKVHSNRLAEWSQLRIKNLRTTFKHIHDEQKYELRNLWPGCRN